MKVRTPYISISTGTYPLSLVNLREEAIEKHKKQVLCLHHLCGKTFACVKSECPEIYKMRGKIRCFRDLANAPFRTYLSYREEFNVHF